MRWMLGVLAVLALLAFVAWSALVPPTSGSGWRLDPEASWEQPLMPDNLAPTVIIYTATESAVGFGVTVYGSSSCPPRVRGVEVRDSTVTVSTARDLMWIFTGCSADAGPHPFGILVDRERLGTPISVVVHNDETPSATVTFTTLVP